MLAKGLRSLRACANVKDGYEFQQELLGKRPQADAPEPRSGLDPALAETWQLEHDVCERLAREYRCVGDALAWRVFGFQRRNIIALCQNAPSGVMAGKAGLEAELESVDRAYREDGQFAILHDLTNDAVVPGDGDIVDGRVPAVHDPGLDRAAAAERVVGVAVLADDVDPGRLFPRPPFRVTLASARGSWSFLGLQLEGRGPYRVAPEEDQPG